MVKASKQHKCDLCGLRIRKGATYWLREGADGPVHWRMRMHPVCRSASDEWSWIDWEEWRPGDEADFRRHVLELRNWRRTY
jgi:hypothetical protein